MKINTARIFDAMIVHGYNYTKAANACGLAKQSYSTILKRESCNIETVAKIAAGLNIPASEIIIRE